MNNLLRSGQISWHLTWNNLSKLFQYIHNTVCTAPNQPQYVIFTGAEIYLCQVLKELWQQSLPESFSSRIPGIVDLQGDFLNERLLHNSFISAAENCYSNPHKSSSSAVQNPQNLDRSQPHFNHRCLCQKHTIFAPSKLAKSAAGVFICCNDFCIWMTVKQLHDECYLDTSLKHHPMHSYHLWEVVLQTKISTVKELFKELPLDIITLQKFQSDEGIENWQIAERSFWQSIPRFTSNNVSVPPMNRSDQLHLSSQEQFSEQLFQQMPIGSFQIDLDGSFIRVNSAFCKLLGYSQAQFRRLDLQSITDAANFEMMLDMLSQVIAYEEPRIFQLQFCHAESFGIWAEVKLSLVGNLDEENCYLLGFVSDLSDLKRNEAEHIYSMQERQKWHERELLLDDIANHICLPSGSLDWSSIMHIATDGLKRVLGCSRVVIYQFSADHEAVCIAEAVDLVYPKLKGHQTQLDNLLPDAIDRSTSNKVWQATDISRAPLTDRQFDLLRQSQVQGVMLAGITIPDNSTHRNHYKFWGILAVHECGVPRHWDVTEVEFVQAIAHQLAIAISHNRLYQEEYTQRQNASYFRTFFEKTTDVFVEYDRQLRCVSINRTGCALLARSQNEIVGKTNRDLLGNDSVTLDALIQQAFDTAERVFVDHEINLPQGRKVLETLYSPIIDSSGTVQRVIGVSRDVTDLKQHWQKLEQQNHQLMEMTRQKQEFVATTSHELRTPLTAILGFSNVLLQEFFGELNPKQKDYLERIHGSGQHLLDLINDILDLSRLEAGRMELEIQTVYIADLCQSVASLVQEQALSQGLEFQMDIASDVEWILADPRRLKQMLLNLLTNAIKFTPVGTVGLKVFRQSNDVLCDETRSQMKDSLFSPSSANTDIIHFLVWDTGIGISPCDQQLLFSPFSQINNPIARQHQGTGLGLAITQKLAELHNGCVTLTSKPGNGSHFTISLPLGIAL
mgnify:CR=1 FL=1